MFRSVRVTQSLTDGRRILDMDWKQVHLMNNHLEYCDHIFFVKIRLICLLEVSRCDNCNCNADCVLMCIWSCIVIGEMAGYRRSKHFRIIKHHFGICKYELSWEPVRMVGKSPEWMLFPRLLNVQFLDGIMEGIHESSRLLSVKLNRHTCVGSTILDLMFAHLRSRPVWNNCGSACKQAYAWFLMCRKLSVRYILCKMTLRWLLDTVKMKIKVCRWLIEGSFQPIWRGQGLLSHELAVDYTSHQPVNTWFMATTAVCNLPVGLLVFPVFEMTLRRFKWVTTEHVSIDSILTNYHSWCSCYRNLESCRAQGLEFGPFFFEIHRNLACSRGQSSTKPYVNGLGLSSWIAWNLLLQRSLPQQCSQLHNLSRDNSGIFNTISDLIHEPILSKFTYLWVRFEGPSPLS